jgi:hypothetical protein
MGKRSVKKTAMLLLCAGCVFQLGGCIATVSKYFVNSIVPFSFLEWTTDNNNVFDLFQDG